MFDMQAHSAARWQQLIVVFLVALALRATALHRVAVEHFDEGVYSSNLLFDDSEGGAYPNRHLYAPPLVPGLIEWSITFFGNGPMGTMLPSLVAGVLTVALTFHVARVWFGNEAAWPTAIIAALSEFHIIYSRAALTDVCMGLFCLLSVFLGIESLRSGSLGRAAAAGIACGLTWACKYNGWLPIAIVSATTFIWFCFHGKAAFSGRGIACVLVMALVSAIVFSPVLWSLQEHGGYTAVAANHRSYVVGLTGWVPSMNQQFGAHRVLDGWVAWSSLSIAALTVLVWQLRTKNFTWNQSRDEFEVDASLVTKVALGALLLSLLAAGGVGTSAVLFCCALGGLAGRLRWPAIPVDCDAGSNDESIARWTLPCWAVVVWLAALTLVTPMYRPYPRITIPWLIAVWLGAGAGISWWVRANLRWHGRKGARRSVARHNLVMLCLCVLSGYIIMRDARTSPPTASAWKPRVGMAELAAAIERDCALDPQQTVVYTYGEPALLYHLNAGGVLARPVSSLPRSAPRGRTVLLIEGPHARATDSYPWAEVQRLYDKIASWEVTPSDLVLLNNHAAGGLLGTPQRPTAAFHAWQLKDTTDHE